MRRNIFYNTNERQVGLAQPQRRHVLAAAVASLVTPRVVLISGVAFGSMVLSAPAKAEPLAVCMAVASAVMGAIQAHNASDGGAKTLATATLEYQRVISGQLNAVLTGIAQLLAQQDLLVKQGERTPEMVDQYALQSALGGAAEQYQALVAASHGSNDFEAWRAIHRTELDSIANKISEKFGVAKYRAWVGPVSAPLLVSATETLLAVKGALGSMTRTEMRALAQERVRIYRLVEDEKSLTSTAGLLLQYKADYEKSVKELAELGYAVNRQSVASLPSADVVLGGASIQDFTPSKLNWVRMRPTPGKPGSDFVTDSQTEVARSETPARVGLTEHFSHSATVAPYYQPIPVLGGAPLQLQQYRVEKAITTRTVPAAVSGATLEQFEAGTPTIRRELALQEARVKASLARKIKLTEELARLDLAGANILACELALLHVRRSRKRLVQRYGMVS